MLPPDITRSLGGPAAWSSLRPESLRISAAGGDLLSGPVTSIRYLGAGSRITIAAPGAAAEVKNVAITDLLPAGLEIENPRLGAQRDLPWLTAAATPDYFDVRDDRINYFTTATGTPKSFYYLARAVSKGTFKLGPVSADAMYNADYHSYNGAGVVRVN